MPSILAKLMSFRSHPQGMARQLYQATWMEVFIHTQWKINRSKRSSLIILFPMVWDMDKIL